MKQGRSLTQLAEEIVRQKDAKRDFVVDTRHLHMGYDRDLILDDPKNPETQLQLMPSNLCHNQIAERIGIPRQYYDRCLKEAPELLARQVNHWFDAKPEQRMVRTLDGRARAFLSKKYRRLDNYDLAEAVLTKIKDLQCNVHSCELTETRLYIKVVTERITAEVVKGDIVQAGIVISNSEVGCGRITIEPLIFRLSCLNGMISLDHSLKRRHIGRSLELDEGEDVAELFSLHTQQLDDAAFWHKVQDVVAATLDEVKFTMIVRKLQESNKKKITGDPVKAIEVTAKMLHLSDNEQGSVLNHLISGGNLSAYGLVNAVTRSSQDVEDYDRATELERLGGQIIELPPNDWAEIAQA